MCMGAELVTVVWKLANFVSGDVKCDQNYVCGLVGVQVYVGGRVGGGSVCMYVGGILGLILKLKSVTEV